MRKRLYSSFLLEGEVRKFFCDYRKLTIGVAKQLLTEEKKKTQLMMENSMYITHSWPHEQLPQISCIIISEPQEFGSSFEEQFFLSCEVVVTWYA